MPLKFEGRNTRNVSSEFKEPFGTCLQNSMNLHPRFLRLCIDIACMQTPNQISERNGEKTGSSNQRWSLTCGQVHTGSFSALTSAKMGRSFWSRPHFREGLNYLQFEYEVILAMAFWEKSKKLPKMGFLGFFKAQMLKLQVLWESSIIKQPPKSFLGHFLP